MQFKSLKWCKWFSLHWLLNLFVKKLSCLNLFDGTLIYTGSCSLLWCYSFLDANRLQMLRSWSTLLVVRQQMVLFPSQIDGKWALDLHFTLLLIPFSMLILPFLLGSLRDSRRTSSGHFKYRKRAKEVHHSGSAIQAEKKGTSSVALQVPFWATWA